MTQSLNIIHSESSKGWGGQEVRTFNEMVALRDCGHAVELVCPSRAILGSRCEDAGFTVHRAEMKTGGNVSSMLQITSLLRRRKFDVVNTHSGHDTLVAGSAARLAGTPLIVRTRHLALPITSLATYNWIPHRVIAVSHHVRRTLVSAGVAARRVETIHDGIGKPEPAEHSTLRSELGLKSDNVLACMVAMMRDGKGHEDLVEAAVPLLKTRPQLHIVMAGDGPIFARVKRAVVNLGLQERIHLLGYRSDIPNVLSGCDFFVLPTHQEALGQAYIEAMAIGLPVIGSDVDGVPELICDGVTGLLVPPRDHFALANAMARMVDEPALRHRLSHAAKDILNRGFSVSDMAYDTVRLYRCALKERGYGK
jgi:glycosyltransferase involved in cell wall biosynthesis